MYALYDYTYERWLIYSTDGRLLCYWRIEELGELPNCVTPITITKTMKAGGF